MNVVVKVVVVVVVTFAGVVTELEAVFVEEELVTTVIGAYVLVVGAERNCQVYWNALISSDFKSDPMPVMVTRCQAP